MKLRTLSDTESVRRMLTWLRRKQQLEHEALMREYRKLLVKMAIALPLLWVLWKLPEWMQ
jgi:hypothetical protein